MSSVLLVGIVDIDGFSETPDENEIPSAHSSRAGYRTMTQVQRPTFEGGEDEGVLAAPFSMIGISVIG